MFHEFSALLFFILDTSVIEYLLCIHVGVLCYF